MTPLNQLRKTLIGRTILQVEAGQSSISLSLDDGSSAVFTGSFRIDTLNVKPGDVLDVESRCVPNSQ